MVLPKDVIPLLTIAQIGNWPRWQFYGGEFLLIGKVKVTPFVAQRVETLRMYNSH